MTCYTIAFTLVMRVTRQVKQATRTRILQAARLLFGEHGFEGTTTRQLAARAGVAASTLFNYFPSKEAMAATLVAEGLEVGRAAFREHRRQTGGLAERLFLLISCELRHLESQRGLVPAVLETVLSPLAEDGTTSQGLRLAHLELVRQLIVTAYPEAPDLTISLHLYWSLYLGVLAFWARDESPGQEDTLAVLDEATRVFALSLSTLERPEA